MVTRRDFLGTLGLPAAAAATGAASFPLRLDALAPRTDTRARLEALQQTPGSPEEIARDEAYWREVQMAFTTDRSMINLNNGGVSPTPAHVLEAMKRDLDFANQLPVYYGWSVLRPQKETVRARMARQWGVSPEEIALTRNASESLEIVQFGYDMNEGDRVLTTDQDYPRMVTAFLQRERREGIVLDQFPIPVPAEDNAEIVRLFEENIRDRTRFILMSHVINLTGQILPVREIVEMARRHDVKVIVDGAHAFAHFDFKISDLGCDNYSTSLHKWLFAPIGNGLLYVRREEIPEIWPLMAARESQDEDIRKFEEIGTAPEAVYLAVGEALTFHQLIGPKRKEARLIHLRNYWAETLLEHDRIRLNTSLKPGFACGIANVEIRGIEPRALGRWLWDEHRIRTASMSHEDQFQGLRITPSVYTTKEELDRFIDAMLDAADNGIPEA